MIHAIIQTAQFPTRQKAIETWKKEVVKLPSDQEEGLEAIYELTHRLNPDYWYYQLLRHQTPSKY